jgi:hypothetical protein
VLAARGREDAIAELQGPEIPEALEYLWGWFLEQRPGGEALSYEDIDAWARLTRRRLEPHEVHAMIELDSAIRSRTLEADDG